MKEVKRIRESQSPENGSRHCKMKERPAWILKVYDFGSQSPENGSRHCKLADHAGHSGLSGDRVAIP